MRMKMHTVHCSAEGWAGTIGGCIKIGKQVWPSIHNGYLGVRRSMFYFLFSSNYGICQNIFTAHAESKVVPNWKGHGLGRGQTPTECAPCQGLQLMEASANPAGHREVEWGPRRPPRASRGPAGSLYLTLWGQSRALPAHLVHR